MIYNICFPYMKEYDKNLLAHLKNIYILIKNNYY